MQDAPETPEVQTVFDAPKDNWVDRFALPKNLHPAVIAFVRTRPDLLETTETAIRRGETIQSEDS